MTTGYHSIVLNDDTHVEFTGSVPRVGDFVKIVIDNELLTARVIEVAWYAINRTVMPGGALSPIPHLDARVYVSTVSAASEAWEEAKE